MLQLLLCRVTIKNKNHTNIALQDFHFVNDFMIIVASIKDKINRKVKDILKNKEALERQDINEENNCFFTLKDYKGNFQNKQTVRLINPAKNEIGRISEVILDKINSSLKQTKRYRMVYTKLKKKAITNS